MAMVTSLLSKAARRNVAVSVFCSTGGHETFSYNEPHMIAIPRVVAIAPWNYAGSTEFVQSIRRCRKQNDVHADAKDPLKILWMNLQ